VKRTPTCWCGTDNGDPKFHVLQINSILFKVVLYDFTCFHVPKFDGLISTCSNEFRTRLIPSDSENTSCMGVIRCQSRFTSSSFPIIEKNLCVCTHGNKSFSIWGKGHIINEFRMTSRCRIESKRRTVIEY
jgi:hypothetical protein